MSNYSKGSRGENELIDIFYDEGYGCVRAAGSGTANRETPDILVGDGERLLAMEVKRWDSGVGYEYVSKQETHDLEWFSEKFGCEYWIAVRFDYGNFGFFKKEELKATDKNYRVDEFKEPERGVEDVIQ